MVVISFISKFVTTRNVHVPKPMYDITLYTVQLFSCHHMQLHQTHYLAWEPVSFEEIGCRSSVCMHVIVYVDIASYHHHQRMEEQNSINVKMKGSVEKGDKSHFITLEKTSIEVWNCIAVHITVLLPGNTRFAKWNCR